MMTIYDIAKAAQTSPASVSRVINGREGVKAEVANRIKTVMETLNFQPRWKALDRNRFLVFAPDYKRAFDNGYVARIMSGIADESFSLGFGLQLRRFPSQAKDVSDLRQLYMQEAVSGCILISLYQGYSIPDRLDEAGLPHVVIGHKPQDDEVLQVILDDFDAGRNATEFLLSLGHRRIAMVSFSHLDQGHLDRYRGFESAMSGIGSDKPFCIQCNEATYEAGKSAARQLLSPHEKPSAVIITNEELAAGFQAETKAMGISVPRDISLLAFEETESLTLLDPPITAMQTPAYTMGVEAVKMLRAMVNAKQKTVRKNSVSKHITISLVARHSTAAVEIQP
ncbi:MAG: LacI family DNA-binding transcriptional regulator [Chthoniobacteraceae bacterium]